MFFWTLLSIFLSQISKRSPFNFTRKRYNQDALKKTPKWGKSWLNRPYADSRFGAKCHGIMLSRTEIIESDSCDKVIEKETVNKKGNTDSRSARRAKYRRYCLWLWPSVLDSTSWLLWRTDLASFITATTTMTVTVTTNVRRENRRRRWAHPRYKTLHRFSHPPARFATNWPTVKSPREGKQHRRAIADVTCCFVETSRGKNAKFEHFVATKCRKTNFPSFSARQQYVTFSLKQKFENYLSNSCEKLRDERSSKLVKLVYKFISLCIIAMIILFYKNPSHLFHTRKITY